MLPREANLFVLAHKKQFHTPKLDLDIAESIPATVGYETYGTLAPGRDNAILICHPFAATSHAAGRYAESDTQAGWWDSLIGPGKAFDTDRFFVVCADTLCNLQTHNPHVITTGPATLNPETGRPYGPDFPQVTFRDNVRLQRALLESLGIEHLVCVAGPGTGGFQALEWAVTYPDMVDRVVAVAAAPQAPAVFALAVCQAGIDAIVADPAYRGGRYYGDGETPARGLERAAFLSATLSRTDGWINAMWERKTAKGSAHPRCARDGRFAFQAEMEGQARQLAALCDPNHFIYTARAAQLHDIGYGNRGLEVAAQKIKAQVLLVPVTGDLLAPPELSDLLAREINLHGERATVVPMESMGGHAAAVAESGKLAEAITEFLRPGVLH